jgi:DNA-directed RNA polymerase III subunit RPC6
MADLKEQFTALLSENPNGIDQDDAIAALGCRDVDLLPIVNELSAAHALTLWQSETSGNMVFKLQDSTQLQGLDAEQMLVYQRIEDSGNKGIWTRELRLRTSIKQQRLTKILTLLENRKLVKPVKAVTAKNKKVYMLYDLVPSRDVTGGPWYSDQEFDFEFVEALRQFLLKTIKAVETQKRRGASLRELAQEVANSSVFSVQLAEPDILTIVNVLKYDDLVEEVGRPQGNLGEDVEVSYKLSRELPDLNFLTDAPCGTCPVASQCSEGGIISPSTCAYMDTWLSLPDAPSEEQQDMEM